MTADYKASVDGHWYQCDSVGRCIAPCEEPVSEKVKRLEKELADLKAKQAEAAKTKTKGEEIAGGLVGSEGGHVTFLGEPNAATYTLNAGAYYVETAKRVIRNNIAAAIDKALADERERCAKEMEKRAAQLRAGQFSYNAVFSAQALANQLCNVAGEIRNLK
jgi:hypothetical protein